MFTEREMQQRGSLGKGDLVVLILTVTLMSLIIIVAILYAVKNTDSILEIGDCVHETAEREGMAHLPAKEQWGLLAEYCK